VRDLAWVVTPAALGLAVLATRRRLPALAAVSRFLEGRWAPIVLGLGSALVTAWMWGSLREPAYLHDEAAYLLQARLFASGHIAGPPAPLPEFFEQFHVLVTPRLAPKYPPGHALVLTPGVALGLAGLMPCLTAGLAGGLLFFLARRLTNAWVAALTWVLWTASPGVLTVSSTYLSNTTSLVSWLGSVAALVQWRRTGRLRWLALTGFLAGWTTLTRPLTGLALGLPLGAVVLWDVSRTRQWRTLLVPAALFVVALAPIPIWSQVSTGDWRLTPYQAYRETYLPWDRLGFGVDPTPPKRPLPRDIQQYADEYKHLRAPYRPGLVPQVLLARTIQYGRDMWGGPPWRWALVLLVIPGILIGGRAALGAAASVALLTLAHAAYPHPPEWTPYYYEIQPALAFLTALGLWTLLARSAGGASAGERRQRAATVASLLAVLALGLSVHDAAAAQGHLASRRDYHRGIRRALSRIPESRAIVFVRYHPAHSPHYSVIENPPDYETARLWIVYDRGEDNERLLRLAPDRTPYLLDEGAGTLTRLPRPASP
jgi:hypothetical protein